MVIETRIVIPNVTERLIESMVQKKVMLIEEFLRQHTLCAGQAGVDRTKALGTIGKDTDTLKCFCGSSMEVTIIPTIVVRYH
jgi:uncharacterized Fe-S radical SAM superfamily protein PflX